MSLTATDFFRIRALSHLSHNQGQIKKYMWLRLHTQKICLMGKTDNIHFLEAIYTYVYLPIIRILDASK